MNAITVDQPRPGRGECLTLQAAGGDEEAQRLILRTEHTPAAEYLEREGIAFTSLTRCMRSAEDFDALNEPWSGAVLEAAGSHAAGVRRAGRAVGRERPHAHGKPETPVRVLPGVGLFDRLRQAASGRAGSARRTLPHALGDEPLLIVEIDSALLAGEIKLAMIDWFGADLPLHVVRSDRRTAQRGKADPAAGPGPAAPV